MGKPSRTIETRFWEKVNKSGDCWVWTACTHKYGYGQIGFRGVMASAHRVSWFLEHGEIPEGLCVLHKCDNPKCVNPDHLFLGTDKDNAQDRKAKGRNGKMHPFGNKHLPARGGENAPDKFKGFKSSRTKG